MHTRLAALVFTLVLFLPSIAHADITAFLGRNSAGDDSSIARGFSFGASLLVIGLEFEYATASEDETEAQPSFRTISGNAPLAIQAAKITIAQVLKDPDKRDMDAIKAIGTACMDSEDFREGRRAFMEKRKPHFRGK